MMLGVAGQLLTRGSTVEVDGYRMTVQDLKRRRITSIDVRAPSV
jgi:CBS domain containing-hemolysin-like protein